MKLIVKPKTKQQEKDIKTFLENHSIDYTKLEEDAAIYRTRKTTKEKQLTKKEKNILQNLDESVGFVNKYKRGRAKTNLVNEIKEAVNEMKLIRSGKKKARNAEDFLNEL